MDAKLSELIRRLDSDSPPSRAQLEQCYEYAIDDTLDKIVHALRTKDAGDFRKLDAVIDELREEVRESVQAITRNEMWNVIVRLRAGVDVSDADMRLIRVWVVGDAVAYVREENNFPGWLSKLDRVSGLIRDLRSKEMDVDTLVELGGLLTDARGVSRSLALYVNDRERVQRFEQSIENGLDKEERLLLADYLVRSYESSKS